MEYEVCIHVTTPPQKIRLYRTLNDYRNEDVSRIIIIGSKHSSRDRRKYKEIKQIYSNIEVVFIDQKREKDKAEELLEMCLNAKHYHTRVIW